MAKDPAFLFYPGDYLRDTQCLSAEAQVAYDRIMCEHMRNICEDMINITISQERLDFFTKRLSEIDKEQLLSVLIKQSTGYHIEWVALSIANRKAYSQSRRKNRKGNRGNHMSIICESYDSHMENEIENEDNLLKEDKDFKREGRFYKLISQKFQSNDSFWEAWKNWYDFNLERGTEITPAQAKIQLKYLNAAENPIYLLEQALANNWKGLVYDKNNGQNKTIFTHAEIAEQCRGQQQHDAQKIWDKYTANGNGTFTLKTTAASS